MLYIFGRRLEFNSWRLVFHSYYYLPSSEISEEACAHFCPYSVFCWQSLVSFQSGIWLLYVFIIYCDHNQLALANDIDILLYKVNSIILILRTNHTHVMLFKKSLLWIAWSFGFIAIINYILFTGVANGIHCKFYLPCL